MPSANRRFMTPERAPVTVGVDLTLRLPDRPGSMAELCERLTRARVAIDGICGAIEMDVDIDHLLVRDADAARSVIETAGGEVRRARNVLVIHDAHRLETLAGLTRRVAEAGVSIDLIYLGTDGRLVLGVDDIKAARSALTT